MITNGFLLNAERIQRLNRAGLDHLQISIDNVMPDDVSKKSLKTLDKKLQPIHQILFVETSPQPVKWALHEMDRIDVGIRLPLIPLSEQHRAPLRERLRAAGLL